MYSMLVVHAFYAPTILHYAIFFTSTVYGW